MELMAVEIEETRQIDPTKLRFVLYARKSTEDEGRQVDSIDDQIRICLEYAETHSLHIVKIIKEEKSAKKYGNRPQFKEMLKGFPIQYYALLAYHPDRVSRNMRDAGEAIDMLNPDNALIKNLAFPTVQYANDSSGRLTLAVLFSLATQFSEHLSEVVKRGVKTKLNKGISSGATKWGYERNEITNYYEPDANFQYVQRAWFMRADGERIADIVKYLKSHDVHRMTKITRTNKKQRKIYPSETSLTKMFSKSFHYGILVQSEQEVDLRKLTNFTPMIDEETFNKVQAVGYRRSRLKPKSSKLGIFYPFRGMVFCGVYHSETPMRVGKNKSQTGEYFLSYRCDNKHCQRTVKSVRAKYILDSLYETLKTLQFTEKEYDSYSKRLDQLTDDKILELREERRSLNGVKSAKEKERDDLSRKFRDMDANHPSYSVTENDITMLHNDVIDIEARIAKIADKLRNTDKIKMNKEEFLNLANTAYDKVLAGTPVEKDIILRKLALNLTLDNKRTPSFIWREPFATMLSLRQSSNGADERT